MDDLNRPGNEEGEELADLQGALQDAREQTPEPGWQERMTKRLEDARDTPEAETDDDHDQRERPNPDRPPIDPEHVLETTAESSVRETAAEVAETDVAPGLTAGLLAAGAAAAWLRRLATRPPPDDD